MKTSACLPPVTVLLVFLMGANGLIPGCGGGCNTTRMTVVLPVFATDGGAPDAGTAMPGLEACRNDPTSPPCHNLCVAVLERDQLDARFRQAAIEECTLLDGDSPALRIRYYFKCV